MNQETKEIILLTLFGTLGSVLVGLIVLGTTIFSPYRANFQFITAGLYGSLFFSMLTFKNKKQQLFAMIGIYFLNLIIFTGRSISFTLVLRDFVSLVALFSAIAVYYQFIHRYQKLKLLLRSFALSFIYGILSVAAGLFLYTINTGIWPPLRFIHVMARYGILIGFGVGMAIDIYLLNKRSILKIFKDNSI